MSCSKHIAKNSFKTIIRATLAIFGTVIGIITERSRRHRSRKSTIIDREGLVEKILKDITRIIDDIKYNIEKSVIDYTSAPEKHVIETDEDIIVHLDLPGVRKEDIKLKITESHLKVKANFDITQEIEKGNNISINDKKSGIFRRSVKFPKKVMAEKAEATFEDGVLTVKIPKVDKTEGVAVEIK